MKQTRIVPFDINKAKNGAKIVTRNGLYPARIGFFDLEGTDLPIIAAIRKDGKEIPYRFTIEGNFCSNKEEDALDLFIEEEVEVRFMTYDEVAMWLTEKPHRQYKVFGGFWVYSVISYPEQQGSKEASCILIRENGGEWHEPLIEEMGD